MGRLVTEEFDSIRQAREEFLARGIIPAGIVSDTIIRSWRRSAERGIDTARGDNRCTPRYDLMQRRDKNHTLLERSQPVMENLYHEICGTSSMVLLADSDGVVLHSIGDPVFVDQAQKVCLKPGGIWTESVNGTNAIGTALEEQLPVQVHSSEHFIDQNRFLSCSATPIFDPRGAVLGALDVSGDYRCHQQHTMALVRLSAQIIENQMFAHEFPDDIIIHFHLKPEFIGTLYEGIVVFSPQGAFLAANRSALLQFGLDRFRMAGHSFTSLFRLTIPKLLEQARFQHHPVLKLQLKSGEEVYGRVWPGASISPITFLPIITASSKEDRKRSTGAGVPVLLNELEFGDRTMQALIGKALKVIGHDIPIMIEGESGTGKELLARALHQAGPRSNGPFVPVNCASIPEGLIESELFGYQEGAFTGARRKGHVGKITEADKGTLFLDEIGDMPLSFQARLLRVLQDRIVTPLGGTKSLPVDIRIICATNRRLRDEIAAGRFREDLYYRLNGLLLTLPPLRNREDRIALAGSILLALARQDERVSFSSSVLDLFARHSWPGNIRQLTNVIRTALALRGGENEITVEHLPEDFLDQLPAMVAFANGSGACETEPRTTSGSLVDLEEMAIRTSLRENGGNISDAARKLGISRNTLYRRLKAADVGAR